MKLKNKLKLLVSSTISSFLLFSCGAKDLPVNNLLNTEVNFSNANSRDYSVQASKKTDSGFTFDLGAKNGAAFSVTLNNNQNKGFNTKANSNGVAPKVKNDIQLLRLYLVDSNASNLTSSNIKYGPFDIIVSNGKASLDTFFSDVKSTIGTGSISFSNVGTGSYYVAVAAYSSTSTINSTTNISNLRTTPAGSTTNINNGTNLGKFALSTSGGDAPGLSGIVTVAPMVDTNGRAVYGLINNGTNDLGVTLDLADSIGANIDTKVTLVDGSNSSVLPMDVE